MYFAYEIIGDKSDNCVFCDTLKEANDLKKQGYFISDIAINWTEKMYVDGKIVDRPIVPPDPPIPPTKEQLLQQLEWEYQPQFLELTRSWANANMDGNTAQMETLKTLKSTLADEYLTKKEAIEND